MLGCCQFRLKTIRESDFSYRSATEYLFLPLWRDFLCTLPSGYWHMCENLLTEFFSSLFRDICIKTYWLCSSSFFLWDICTETYWLCPSSFARWDICTETYRLCPFSFAHWDIYMKTYSLCPFSFVSRDIYARKNAICPIAADIRDIMQRNDSICPTVPKKWDITEQKFSICPQDRLAYYRFLYITVSSPLTCDWLRFSRMRISAISRCAVFEIPFSL